MATRIDDESELPQLLNELKSLHPKARHFCYGYRIGLDDNRWRANDDGEPTNSAGRPILGQIDAAELTNVVVVVVRYFGGSKLGIPGLIEAYRRATSAALEDAERYVAVVENSLIVRTDYAHYAYLLQAVTQVPWRILSHQATEEVVVNLACPASSFAEAYRQLWLVLAKAYPGEEQLDQSPPGYTLELLP